jgi:hypothetical protein
MIMSCFQNCGTERLSEAAMAGTEDVYLCMDAPPGKHPRLDLLPSTDVKNTSVERDLKSRLP